MFKNALVFRIAQWEPPPLAQIEERLDAARFVPCGATQAESVGWLPPRGDKHGALLETVGGQWVLKLGSERKAVPGSAVKDQLEVLLDKAERETGRRPKGKHAKELKEQIVHELLPRAFPKKSSTLVWVDEKHRLVLVDAGSVNKADQVSTLLVEALGGGIVLQLLDAQTSPAVAMANWLKTKEAPAGFTIDRECELKQPDSDKASVRYARHTLDIDEVAAHIDQGKFPTQLAMTWEGRVSFVLTEGLALRKIKLLDVKSEGADDGGFDADVAIATGELGPLLADLLAALGGELQRGEPAPAPEPAAAATAPWDVEPAAA